MSPLTILPAVVMGVAIVVFALSNVSVQIREPVSFGSPSDMVLTPGGVYPRAIAPLGEDPFD